MKTLAFASRNTKEIMRDKINLFFGLGFPLVLLLLLSVIQSNIPVDMFEIKRLVPGIAAFGLSFIALFSGTLIAKDRTSSFMLRMFTSPMSSTGFILGYTLPLVPMAALQMLVCFAASLIFGLEISVNILVCVAVLLPAAVLNIAIGLLCGSVLNDKQVGGICGALLTNVSAWLSGTWFDISLVGGGFKKFAELLPFAHAVNAGRAAIAGDFAAIMPELWWVIAYAVVMMIVAVLVFKKKMNGDSI